MAEKQSESVQKKLSLSLDEIIALNNKQQRQQKQPYQRQDQQGPVRRQQRRPFQPVASPYKRPLTSAFGNRAIGYSVRVVGLPDGHPWPRLEQMIRKVFGVCGDITRIVRRNDGSAWIQYADVSACRRALAELQNAKVGGQAVTVERGSPIATSPPGPQGGWQGFPSPSPASHSGAYPLSWAGSHNGDLYAMGGPYYQSFSRPAPTAPSARNPMTSTVIVSNVPLNLTSEEIADAFSVVGPVASTDILLSSSGVHTGRVAVSFARRTEASEAVRRFDGGDLNGNMIRVFME